MGIRCDPDTRKKLLSLAGVSTAPQKRAKPPAPDAIPPVPERLFARAVVEFAGLHGWSVYSVPDSRRCTAAGFPDQVFMHPTGPVPLCVAELKRVGKKPRANQTAWLAAFRFAGVPAYCWTVEDWPEIQRVLGG